MDFEEAKKFLIGNYDPKGLALRARRDSYFVYPIQYSEHREGGGVVIDWAKWDFEKIPEKETIRLAEDLKVFEMAIQNNHGKSLCDFLNQFPPTTLNEGI